MKKYYLKKKCTIPTEIWENIRDEIKYMYRNHTIEFDAINRILLTDPSTIFFLQTNFSKTENHGFTNRIKQYAHTAAKLIYASQTFFFFFLRSYICGALNTWEL